MDIKYLVVHCAATPPSMDIGKEEIKKWHTDKGWDDIGYHVVICRNGDIEFGRPFDVPGAHVRGYNSKSLGVCLVGGVDEDNNPDENFTNEQYHSLIRVLTGLKFFFRDAEICGHRDFPGVTKACPSFDVKAWLGSNELV